MESNKLFSVKRMANLTKNIAIIILLTFVFILSFHGIKIRVDKQYIPGILNHTYLNVLTDSMNPEFRSNDLIIGAKIDSIEELKVGDVITYRDGKMLVTHRIYEINSDEKTIKTKGDANNVVDKTVVTEELLVSRYVGKIPYLGYVVAKFQDFIFLAFLWLIFMYVIIKELFIEVRKEKSKKAMLT